VYTVATKGYDIEKELKEWLINSKRVVIAGIGNPIRSDDYVGMKIIEDLQGQFSENVRLLECETVPENYLFEIEEFKPSHVLLIDAAFLGLSPGETRLLGVEKIIDFPPITTHVLPLRIFCEYVKGSTKAKIALLLIEPKSMKFGEGLSFEVQQAAENIRKALVELLG
jgi:hydrogenase 3 maturation protease